MVLYFAGFGANIDDQNYILGIAARNDSKYLVQSDALAMNEVLALLRKRAEASIAILDTGFFEFRDWSR